MNSSSDISSVILPEDKPQCRDPHWQIFADPWIPSSSRTKKKTIPSHPIPSHPIPSHPIPSHPIPSHRIPSHPIPSHPIPSHPIPSHPIPSHPIPSHPIPSHPIAFHPIPSHPIPSHPIPSHPIPSHPIPSHPIPSHPIPSHPIPSHSIPSHSIPSHSIPSHPIPSHPIPFHPIPFHPIPSHPINQKDFSNLTEKKQQTSVRFDPYFALSRSRTSAYRLTEISPREGFCAGADAIPVGTSFNAQLTSFGKSFRANHDSEPSWAALTVSGERTEMQIVLEGMSETESAKRRRCCAGCPSWSGRCNRQSDSCSGWRQKTEEYRCCLRMSAVLQVGMNHLCRPDADGPIPLFRRGIWWLVAALNLPKLKRQ